jgi:Ca2+-transporting ATPase
VGLGFDAAGADLMRRRPRAPDAPVLGRGLGAHLALDGLLIAIGTLLVVAWAEPRYGLLVATTMGLTTASLTHVVAAASWRDRRRSVVSHETVANGRFVTLSLVVLGLTVLVTSLPILQRLFGTTDLAPGQWGACLLGAAGYLVCTEIVRAVVRAVHRPRA